MLRLRKAAYTLDAIIEAGVPPAIARTLLASGPRAVPERAYQRATGGRRTKQAVTTYVWGPDAMALLQEDGR